MAETKERRVLAMDECSRQVRGRQSLESGAHLSHSPHDDDDDCDGDDGDDDDSDDDNDNCRQK